MTLRDDRLHFVACGFGNSGQNGLCRLYHPKLDKWDHDPVKYTHRVMDINPFGCLRRYELAANVEFRIGTISSRAFPVLRLQFSSFRVC